MKVWHKVYDNIITLENIFLSFHEFKRNKRKTTELLSFEKRLEDNLFALHEKLRKKTYRPGSYIGFYINDPKIRLIHKATLVDRIVHHIVSHGLEEIFERTFIYHSYACRKNKGTHKGVLALQKMSRKVSKNNTRPCYALKCDIKKFFASVNHEALLKILSKRIKDKDYLSILEKIIKSFNSGKENKGLPIGNLTSQYFANIYMNEFDQFIKHKLKVKYYLRYTDDFIILSHKKHYLEELLKPIENFLKQELDLELHPHKINFLNLRDGIDFLGYIVFPHHILPRHKTKKRMFRKLKLKLADLKEGEITFYSFSQTIQAYLGFLSHSNSYRVQNEVINLVHHETDKSTQIFRALRAKRPKSKIPKEPNFQAIKNL